jgi:hypothetical protein
MSNLDENFCHLEIEAGVRLPLTDDTRVAILAAATAGDSDSESQCVVWARLSQLPYLADLLGIPFERTGRVWKDEESLRKYVSNGLWKGDGSLREHAFWKLHIDGEEVIWEALRKARALKLGLPADTPIQKVLAEERKTGVHLTIAELKRARDIRNGTYVPVIREEW